MPTENITWVNKDQNGEVIKGFFKEKEVFEIKRGVSLYTLRITDGKIGEIYRKETSFLTHNSTEYNVLKNKALKIFKKYEHTYN